MVQGDHDVFGDLRYLQRLIAESGFEPSVVATTLGERDGIWVEYMTNRLS